MKNALGNAIAVLILFGSFSLGAVHDGDHGEGPTDLVFKVGKTGDVTINRDVKLGTYLVKRGKYMLTHKSRISATFSYLPKSTRRKNQPS